MIGTFNGINQVNSIFNRNGWIMNRKKKKKKKTKYKSYRIVELKKNGISPVR